MKITKILVTSIIITILLFLLVYLFMFAASLLHFSPPFLSGMPGETIKSLPVQLVSSVLSIFVYIIVLVLVYALLNKSIPGTGIRKGLWYGLIIWLLTTLDPSKISQYLQMKTGVYVLLLIVGAGLIGDLLIGAVVAFIYGEERPNVVSVL